MPDALRLAAAAAEIGMNYAAGRRQHARREISDVLAELVLATAAGILVVAAVAFLFVALWCYLVTIVSTAQAALIMAGVLLLVAVLLLAASRVVSRRKRRPAQQPDQLELLLGEATKVVQKNKGSLLLAAFLAGLFASERRRPQMRAR